MKSEEIEAEAAQTAEDIIDTANITLLFGKKQLELIKKLLSKAYVNGKIKAKMEEIEGVLK
jgi:hypothetical protein